MSDAAKKEEKKEPSVLDRLSEQNDKTKEYLYSVKRGYSSAFENGHKKFLEIHKLQDGDLKGLKKILEDKKNRELYAKSISSGLLEHGKKNFGWKIDESNDALVDAHLQGLYGISQGIIHDYVNKSRESYQDVHDAIMKQHIKQVSDSSHKIIASKYVSSESDLEKILDNLNIDKHDGKDKKHLLENYMKYRDDFVKMYVDKVERRDYQGEK